MNIENIAEAVYPKEHEGIPFLCDSTDIELFRREGYITAFSHFKEFMEWAYEWYDLNFEEKRWYHCATQDNFTTEELYCWWWENVKHKNENQ